VFSQFKMMIELLEDYLRLAGTAFETITGDVTGNARQMGIDRVGGQDVGIEQGIIIWQGIRIWQGIAIGWGIATG
jgi:hypothetical protein